MRIKPNYGLVVWAGLSILAIPWLTYFAYTYVTIFHATWNPYMVQGSYGIIGFFGFMILIYGIFSARIFLEFGDDAVRYRGYLFTRRIPLEQIKLILERAVYHPRGPKSPSYYTYNLLFCRKNMTSSTENEQCLLSIKEYFDIFRLCDVEMFVKALLRQHPGIEIDPALRQRLNA